MTSLSVDILKYTLMPYPHPEPQIEDKKQV